MDLSLSILLWSTVNDSRRRQRLLFTLRTIALLPPKAPVKYLEVSLFPRTPDPKTDSVRHNIQPKLRFHQFTAREPNPKFIPSLNTLGHESPTTTMYLRNGKCTSEPPTRRQTKLTRRRLLQEMTPQSSPPPTQPPNDSTPNNNSTPTSDPTTPSSSTRSPPSSPPPSPPPSPPSSPPPSPPPSPTSPPSSPPSSPLPPPLPPPHLRPHISSPHPHHPPPGPHQHPPSPP